MNEITLPALPYAMDALSPHISKETLEFHYGKHHQAYVTNLNKLLPGTIFEFKSLLEIIKNSSGPIFNNAAQVYNHSFYWDCLSPTKTEPSPALLRAIQGKYGDLETFKASFTQQALANFGSGWTWMVKNSDETLEIINTSNAQTPISGDKHKPLLTCDVWEHAYYIDYRNARPKYLDAFWELCNWKHVSKCFE